MLVLCRPDSFLIAIAIVGTLLFAFKDKSRKWRNVLLSLKSSLIYVTIFLTVFNLEWTRLNPLFISGVLQGSDRYYPGGFVYVLKKTFSLQLLKTEFYGQFFNGIDYLTINLPLGYYILLLIAFIIVLLSTFRFATRNQRYIIILMVATFFIFPIIYDQLVYYRLQTGFQYRYIIPYEIGLAFLVGEILDNGVMKSKSDLHSRKRFNLGSIVSSKITVIAVSLVTLLGFYETFYFDWRFQSFTKIIVQGKALFEITWTPPGGLYFDLGFELTAISIFVLILWLTFQTKNYLHSNLQVENTDETSK